MKTLLCLLALVLSLGGCGSAEENGSGKSLVLPAIY